jgi:hypothetical protein
MKLILPAMLLGPAAAAPPMDGRSLSGGMNWALQRRRDSERTRWKAADQMDCDQAAQAARRKPSTVESGARRRRTARRR